MGKNKNASRIKESTEMKRKDAAPPTPTAEKAEAKSTITLNNYSVRSSNIVDKKRKTSKETKGPRNVIFGGRKIIIKDIAQIRWGASPTGSEYNSRSREREDTSRSKVIDPVGSSCVKKRETGGKATPSLKDSQVKDPHKNDQNQVSKFK